MTKSTIAALILALIALTILAGANNNELSDHVTVVSVENVRQFRNASYIMLEGQIGRYLGKDKYIFNDDTGSVVVKITPEKLDQFTVSDGDRVRIRGEIERSWFSRPTVGAIEVEVIE